MSALFSWWVRSLAARASRDLDLSSDRYAQQALRLTGRALGRPLKPRAERPEPVELLAAVPTQATQARLVLLPGLGVPPAAVRASEALAVPRAQLVLAERPEVPRRFGGWVQRARPATASLRLKVSG